MVSQEGSVLAAREEAAARPGLGRLSQPHTSSIRQVSHTVTNLMMLSPSRSPLAMTQLRSDVVGTSSVRSSVQSQMRSSVQSQMGESQMCELPSQMSESPTEPSDPSAGGSFAFVAAMSVLSPVTSGTAATRVSARTILLRGSSGVGCSGSVTGRRSHRSVRFFVDDDGLRSSQDDEHVVMSTASGPGVVSASSSHGKSRRLLAEGLRREIVQVHDEEDAVSSSTSLFSSKDIVELLTFTGCEHLLRASRLSHVMSRGGDIFQGSAGSSATYELSHQVQHIHHFLSHNWSVPRWKKFLALTFHFNFDIAAWVTLLFMGVIAAVSMTGYVPYIQDLKYGRAGYPGGILCRLFAVPTFLLSALLARDVQRWFGKGGPSMFLDKTCIHQVDKDLQKRGIEKLGAFLCHSDVMVVLYTDVYLQKLWTVYEVASFLALHSTDRMKVVPLDIVLLFFAILTGCCVSGILSLVVKYSTGSEKESVTAGGLFMAYFFGFCVRHIAHNRCAMFERLGNFSVKDTVCFDEADRPVVYKNIAALIRETHPDLASATEEQALERFDALVREELPQALKKSMGRLSLAHKHIALLMLCARGCAYVDRLVGIAFGRAVLDECTEIVFCLLWMVGVYPLCYFVTEISAKWFLNWRGWREILWCFFAQTFLVVAPTYGFFLVGFRLEKWSRTNWQGLLVYAIVALAVISLAHVSFASFTCRSRDKDAGSGSWTLDLADGEEPVAVDEGVELADRLDELVLFDAVSGADCVDSNPISQRLSPVRGFGLDGSHGTGSRSLRVVYPHMGGGGRPPPLGSGNIRIMLPQLPLDSTQSSRSSTSASSRY